MATFAYVGRTRSGAVKKGELSAKTRDEAVDQLRKQSVVVTSLEEKKVVGSISVKSVLGPVSRIKTWLYLRDNSAR